MFKRTKISTGVLVALGGVLLAPVGVQAQETQRIEITGSSIKRVDAETALPVQVINRQEIERSGAVSTQELLSNIAALSSQGGTSTSVGVGNSTYGVSTISLRGLGEDRTLVLVNGRRLAAFAGGNGAAININAIPLAAIERVEVLKDGASALYGSDAIAGVVNFILTRDFKGFEVGGTMSAPTRSGGGKSNKAYIVAGFGDDRFNLTLSGQFERETQLFAKDRSFAKTGNIPPFLAASATGQGNIEGGYTPGTGSAANGNWVEGTRQPGFGGSPGTGYGNPLAASGQCADINMFDAGLTSKGAPYCQFDSNAFVGLLPKRDLDTFSGNFVFRLSNSHELFGDALYSKSKVKQQFQPSPVRRSFLITDALFAQQGVDPAMLLRPGNPNYQTAADYLTAQGFPELVGQTLAVTARVFDFGDRTSLDTSTQSRAVAGLRGNLANQDYEVAFSANRNKLSGTVPKGYFSQVKFVEVVNRPDSDYNPWSLTQSDEFNRRLAESGALYDGSTLDATSNSNGVDATLRGDLMALPAGSLQYAAGMQWRKEDFVTKPSPALETGDIAGLGGATPPVDKSRRITGAFLELNAPIVKNLEANLAARGDRYSDAGNSTTYKASIKWKPMQQVALRASYGTGFRAPTLIDLFQPQTLGSTEQFNDPWSGQTDVQVNSLTGGNPTLKPEKSKQGSIGMVLSPVTGLTATVDFFDIKVTDIIALPSVQEIVDGAFRGDPTYVPLVTLGPGGNEVESLVQVLQNVGKANVQGIDLDVNYRTPLGGGRLDVGLNGTYISKFTQTTPGGVTFDKVGNIVDTTGTPVPSTHSSVVDGVVVRWKHALSFTYSYGSWAGTLTQNYYSGYEDSPDLNGDRHFVPAQSLWDLNVAYTGIKNLRLAVGVKNLFDKDPPIFIPTSNQFQAGYDVTMYDPRARTVYLSAAYKF